MVLSYVNKRQGGGGKRGEMTQTLYAHMNKRKKKQEQTRSTKKKGIVFPS
jgi:hypothetical protein